MSMDGWTSDEARELCLYIENTEPIYRAYFLPIARNLERKWIKGIYDLDLGIKGMRHGVDAAARQYNLEHSSMWTKWSDMFSVKERNEVAEHLCLYLVAEWRAGNHFNESKTAGKGDAS